MTMTLNNDIDWSKISSVEDIRRLDKNLLYDSSPPMDGNIYIRHGLTEEEKEDAKFWKQYYEGKMIVTGDTGGGKGIFIHMLMKKMSYYFDKLIVTDTKPRESFGGVIPPIPFSFPMFVEQIDRLEEVQSGIARPYYIQSLMPGDFEDRDDWKEYRDASVDFKFKELEKRGLIPKDSVLKEYDYNKKQFIVLPNFKPHIDEKTGKWLSSRGDVFIRHSVITMDEAGAKYIPNGKPNLSEAKIILNACNFTRHLQALLILVSVDVDDFNPQLFDKVTWHAKCVQLDNKNYQYDGYPDDLVFKVYIDPVKVNMNGKLEKAIGKGEVLIVNGSTPRKMCGGLGWKDIYNSQNAQGMYIPSRLRRRQ